MEIAGATYAHLQKDRDRAMRAGAFGSTAGLADYMVEQIAKVFDDTGQELRDNRVSVFGDEAEEVEQLPI
jgi:hypothetical protein